jgi:nucleotide-binding universal stress UspA family protein
MKVLIPVQDAVFGDAITDLITSHRWPADTEFKLFTVVEYGNYGEMLGEMYCCDYSHGLLVERQEAAKRLLEEYAAKLDKAMPGACIEQETAFGMPKEMILDGAERWGADLIVMGSHARKGISRFLLGSVSSAVLSASPCSVVIVKLPKQHDTKRVEDTEEPATTSGAKCASMRGVL